MNRFELDPTSLSRETPIRFPGPAGEIQGLWRPAPPGSTARGVVVVAHPHPQFGGTMLNKVVFHTARVLNHDLRVASLRFNFRGVGSSDGTYDEGRGEQKDLFSAWREARSRCPGLPLIAAGFSFGAAMTLHAAARADAADRPAALALIGLPFGLFKPPPPVLIPLAAVHGEADQFTPPDQVETYLSGWSEPRAFQVEPKADHFLEGSLPSATAFLSRKVGGWVFGEEL